MNALHIRGQASTIEVAAPAKLNLFLEVLSKRSDGFHEIETLMVPISLFDTLTLFDNDSGQIELESAGQPADLPSDTRQNTVVRALELLRSRTGCSRGARAVLVKRIPTAAGLAGGSSDAAAALAGANRLWGLRLGHAELAELAAEIGSDVPFFLGGMAAVCRGRGERIERCHLPAGLHFVVIYPSAGLSTADVYRSCRPAATPCRAAPLVAALATGRLHEAGKLLHNGLQAPASSLSSWVEKLSREFQDCEVLGSCQSGSGTSHFGLCASARTAQRVAGRLRARGWHEVFAVRSM